MEEFDFNWLRKKPCKIKIACDNKILWRILKDRIISNLPGLNIYYLTYTANKFLDDFTNLDKERKMIKLYEKKRYICYKKKSLIVYNSDSMSVVDCKIFNSINIYVIHNKDYYSDYTFKLNTNENDGLNVGKCLVYKKYNYGYFKYEFKLKGDDFIKYDLSTVIKFYYKSMAKLTKEQKDEIQQKAISPSRVEYYLELGYEIDDIFC